MQKRILRYILIVSLFLVFSIISQVGGVVYIISLWISKAIRKEFKFKKVLIFSTLYIVSVYIVVPLLAPFWGRERVIHKNNIKPASYITVLLNRNYVTKGMNVFLNQASNELHKHDANIQIRYLDACFPFIKGCPLLPHLSHNDGKKIDFSLVYKNQQGAIVNKSKSISGYGVFESPKPGEFNQTKYCKSKGFYQYDFTKYLTLGRKNNNLEFSEEGTKQLILALLKQKQLSKIFIEPHLKKRMKLTSPKIRFQGCRAVRHDDHIHVQVLN